MNIIIIPVRFLTESALMKLYNNTVQGFPTPRKSDSGRVQIASKEFIPLPNAKSVGVKAVSRSSAKEYNTQMFFDNVVYVDQNTEGAGNVFAFESPDGQELSIEPISYNNGDVKVNCSCLDFYYRFAVWNHNDGSLHGDPPPPYIKKTDRAPVNPDRIPGLCKHLMALADELKSEKFLR
jgi:hypothetical protein